VLTNLFAPDLFSFVPLILVSARPDARGPRDRCAGSCEGNPVMRARSTVSASPWLGVRLVLVVIASASRLAALGGFGN